MALENKRHSRGGSVEREAASGGAGAPDYMESVYDSVHKAIESGTVCWHEAEGLMPHRLPARMVDFVVWSEELGAFGLARVRGHWPCLEPVSAYGGDLRLPSEACAELIAQTYAGIAGLQNREASDAGRKGVSGVGFLVGLRDFSFSGESVCLDDELLICLVHSSSIGEVSLIQGEVWKNRRRIAEGQVKVYVPAGDTEKIA